MSPQINFLFPANTCCGACLSIPSCICPVSWHIHPSCQPLNVLECHGMSLMSQSFPLLLLGSFVAPAMGRLALHTALATFFHPHAKRQHSRPWARAQTSRRRQQGLRRGSPMLPSLLAYACTQCTPCPHQPRHPIPPAVTPGLTLISLQRIWADTMWLLRRLPTRNMRQSLPSRWEMTAARLNMRVSARFLGWDILMNMQPMRNASTIDPSSDWKRKSTMPSGQRSVM